MEERREKRELKSSRGGWGEQNWAGPSEAERGEKREPDEEAAPGEDAKRLKLS